MSPHESGQVNPHEKSESLQCERSVPRIAETTITEISELPPLRAQKQCYTLQVNHRRSVAEKGKVKGKFPERVDETFSRAR